MGPGESNPGQYDWECTENRWTLSAREAANFSKSGHRAKVSDAWREPADVNFGNQLDSNPIATSDPNSRQLRSSSRLLKISPFTLRHAQGERGGVENVDEFPFMLSPSKHENLFSAAC